MLRNETYRFIGCESGFDEADIVLFGAPFDSTTSFRPGARFGPRAIRTESIGIETYSPYQDRDLTEFRILDAGDLELPFGDPAPALSLIEETAGEIVSAGKLPFLLGGEHLVSLGALRAVHARHPDLCVVHFDAHADLREDYLGQKLSHACVMRRIWELVGDGRIRQYGIRSGDRTEFVWGRKHVHTHLFDLLGLYESLRELEDRPIYLTVDLDVLDPSDFPGTGTPEAGGVRFAELLEAVRWVCGKNVVGCDLCELCPQIDPGGRSTALACKMLREMLIGLGRHRKP